MKQRRAAAPYAKALFALAKERNQTELVGRELGDVAATFESDLDLRDFFARPWIPATAKRTVATEVAQRSGLSTLTSDFLALVAARGRADHLQAMAQKYQELADKDLGRVRARVRTAVPLTDDERRMLSGKLAQALGSQVVLEEVVDSAMLGGFIVESGSVVLDGSLEGQLDRMRHRLEGGSEAAPQRVTACDMRRDGAPPAPAEDGCSRWRAFFAIARASKPSSPLSARSQRRLSLSQTTSLTRAGAIDELTGPDFTETSRRSAGHYRDRDCRCFAAEVSR